MADHQTNGLGQLPGRITQPNKQRRRHCDGNTALSMQVGNTLLTPGVINYCPPSPRNHFRLES